MPSPTVPAAALGLPFDPPSFDRRAFLSTLAAAGVLTSSATPAAASGDNDDAGLIELVNALFAARAEIDELDRRADDDGVFDRSEALKPAVPNSLFYREDVDTFEICHDPSGLEVAEDGTRQLFFSTDRQARLLRCKVRVWRDAGTGESLLPRAEAILAALEPYIDAVKQAEAESGLAAYLETSRRVTVMIDDLTKAIAATPASTIAGVAAKARVAAITGWSDRSAFLGDVALPRMLSGQLPYPDEIVMAVSVVVDAMKLAPFADKEIAA